MRRRDLEWEVLQTFGKLGWSWMFPGNQDCRTGRMDWREARMSSFRGRGVPCEPWGIGSLRRGCWKGVDLCIGDGEMDQAVQDAQEAHGTAAPA